MRKPILQVANSPVLHLTERELNVPIVKEYLVVPTGQPSNGRESENLHRLPSVGELERGLSQDVQASYRKLVGAQPKKVICHLFGNCIGIVIEQSVTAVERLLASQENELLVSQVRKTVDNAFRNEIFQLVKQRMGVEASSVLIETSLEAGTTGSLVVLVSLPSVRNAASIPKAEKNHRRNNGKTAKASQPRNEEN